MVRLSLVNLYLHGFVAPQIHEYDTLTSEDRWNEYADVILANPPFMSPKGGIRPHNRFSVKSKRSEVLFVDYMAEHLTPSGRAGIIVPEGIIFQSQNAYKQLRKMLVEEYLVAVVSLPAGVFNPYSGVKTSILILDKGLARRRDSIGFFRVENDGFDLGAQRRVISKNDLPQIGQTVTDYLNMEEQDIQDEESADSMLNKLTGQGSVQIVAKDKIAKNGEYNLSGERYRESRTSSKTKWPMAELGEVAKYINGFAFKPEDWHRSGTPIIRIQNLTGSSSTINLTERRDIPNKYLIEQGDLLISWSATIGFYIWDSERAYLNQHIFKVIPSQQVIKLYLYYLGRRITEEIKKETHGNTMTHITKGRFESIRIPLPPLEVQREIVEEIEGYQKVIDGARAVVKNYRPHITIDPDWPMVELGTLCTIGGNIAKEVDLLRPYFGADSIESNTGKIIKIETAQAQGISGPVYEFSGERLLYSKIRPYLNKVAVVDLEGYCSSDMYPLLPKYSKVQTLYLANYMLSKAFNEQIQYLYERASIPKINRSQLFETKIPLPALETQQTIVAEIEAEKDLVKANQDLIERMERKIGVVISRVWGNN